MVRRRAFATGLLAMPGLCGLPVSAQAQSRAMRQSDALHVGADAVAESLARALLRGFGRESGLAARLQVAPSAPLLTALEQGEIDVVFTLAPEIEKRIEDLGLLHDRRLLGMVEMLLAGPADGPVPARGRDIVEALRRIATAGARFIGRTDGSGLHLAEQALWRAAGISPSGPWLIPADSSPLIQARVYRAYVFIDRARYRAGAARDRFGIAVGGDPRMTLPLHVMRSFRATHAAGKLFVNWVSGPAGRRVIAGQPGLRAATAGAKPDVRS